MTEPCDLTALAARRAIAAGQLNAEALARSCLERVEAREPEVQAWEALDAEALLAQARQCDSGGANGLLHGLPLGVKDIIATAGLPTGNGSPIYAGAMLPFDAAVVALTRLAGGVVMGKTVTTEFACYQPGKTRNPRNPAHTPGGSSSGSAAAVAAGMVPLALGTQTAGSVVRPAAFCGVVGYKPSYGLIEAAGVKTLARNLDTVGVFTRSVADAALYVEAVTGVPLLEAAERAQCPAVIGLCRSPAWPAASPAMQAAFEALPERLAPMGARVRDVELPAPFPDALAAQERIMAHEAFRALSHEWFAHREQLSRKLAAMLEQGREIPRATYEADLALRAACRAMIAGVFADVDVLLVPSAPGAAPRWEEGTGNPAFNRLWTLLGTPCVNVPGLRDEQGLPLGVQVVAAPGADARALAAAAWLEEVIGEG